MKKLLFVILVFILSFSSVGVAMAASKPPPKICLNWSTTLFTTVLSIKPFGGNITITSGEKIKFYAIHGELTNGSDFSAPVAGSGHMDGDVFHFSLTGSTLWIDGNIWTFQFEGFWDVVNDTGTGSDQGMVRNTGTGNIMVGEFDAPITLQPGTCSTTVILYSADSLIQDTNRVPGQAR